MAYSDDILALNPDHHWKFDGNVTDSEGALTTTATGLIYTGPALCEDVTNSMFTDADNDSAQANSSSNINGQTNGFIWAGWFMPSEWQLPPVRIVGDGGFTEGEQLQIAMGYGNNIVFEFWDSGDLLQIAGDTPLIPTRHYHLAIGVTASNELVGYLDGVKQTDTVDAQAGSGLDARTSGIRWGGVQKSNHDSNNPSFGIGSNKLLLVSNKNGYYNQWATWNNDLTDTQIREELFEKGALPHFTVPTGTQIAMQSSLDSISITHRPNVPLCIRIEDVSGGGDLNLLAEGITFDPLASIHIQWMGTGTLTWENDSNSDASIYSAPNGGTVIIENPANLTINGIIVGAEVRIYDDEIPGDGAHNTELAGTENNGTTSFVYAHAGATNDIVIQMIATGYEEIKLNHTLTSENQTITLFPKVETNA